MRFIPIFAIAILFFSCGKDKFTTKPQLKYKSVNRKTISGSETLVFKLDLTDKEGDFTTLLGIKKLVPGCPSTPSTPGSEFIDSLKFPIPPDFINTKGTHGEVVVTLDQGLRGNNGCTLPGGAAKPDTAVFKFWTRDKAGHVSDTAVSEPIIILN
jgi:hypothetical protein